LTITNRVRREAGTGQHFLRLGENLAEERVVGISRLDPSQIRLGQAERKGLARLSGGSQKPFGDSDEPAELVEIGYRVGHHRVPVRSGGRGGLHARDIASKSYDCHRQSIVTEPFFVRKQQQDRERGFVQHK
jgi:hypothetical protein